MRRERPQLATQPGAWVIISAGASPRVIPTQMPGRVDFSPRAVETKLAESRVKTAGRGVDMEPSITPLSPSEAIANRAEEIPGDLIAMGTRGLSGPSRDPAPND